MPDRVDSTNTVEYSVADGIAILRLNRPNAYNALNVEMSANLITCLRSASADESVRVIVITGRGKAFCAGVDLKEASSTNEMFGPNSMGPNSPIVAAFSECKKPIIGAVNGVAVTGGLELALACDFLYAAESARFADTHALVGLLPGWGLSQKMPRIIGIQRAREMSFTGVYFSAHKACEWGMVNQVCPDDKLLEQAVHAASLIRDTVPVALEKIKSMMNDGWESDLGSALEMEGKRANEFNGNTDLSGMNDRLQVLRKRAKGSQS